jgi:hypothetical protein
MLPKSKDAAQMALRVDDNLAEAHVAMGGKSLLYERDWTNAEKEFQRAPSSSIPIRLTRTSF